MPDETDAEARRLVAALVELDRALADDVDRSLEIQRRVRNLQRGIDAGESLASLVEAEDQPRTVEMITENIETLHGIGARLRAAQALALRAEGLSITEIAQLFGVTRQRVSALLKQKAADD